MRTSKWLALVSVGSLLSAGPADHFPSTTDPMLNYFADPPVIYTFLLSDAGKETAVRIEFPSFTSKVNVTNPSGFAFLRQSVSGPLAPRLRRNGSSLDLPDPDEHMFDPWDLPDPVDDFPVPDPPLPDPFEDPFDLPDPIDLPPLPDDEMDVTDISTSDVSFVDFGGEQPGYGLKQPLAAAPRAISTVARLQVGPSPAGIVTSPDQNTLYVAVMGNGSIAVVDRKARTVKSRIALPAGTQPYALAITPDGSRLYTGEFTQGSALAYSVDLPAGTVKKLAVPGSFISHALVTPDGTQLWLVNYFGNIQIYDVLTNAYVGQIAVTAPWNVAFNATGTLAYVSAGTAGVPGTVNVYSVSTRQQVASIPVGARPRALRVTKSGRHIFVAHYDSTFVSQIDTATNKVIRNISVGGDGANGIAMANK